MTERITEGQNKENAKATFKNILKILGDVALYAFIIIGLLCVLVAITSKKDKDGTATIFGYQLRTVETSSMDYNRQFDEEVGYDNVDIKELPINTMVFIEVVPEDPEERAQWYADLKEGDVITFRYSEYGNRQIVVTHRLVSKVYRESDGGYTLTLKGDNGPINENSLADEQVIDSLSKSSFNYVIGKVTGSSKVLGWIVTTLQKPIGLILVIILPCAIIIVYEVMRIISMFGDDKKKRQLENDELNKRIQKEQQDEIEELKKKLAMIENKEDAPKEEIGAEEKD